MSDINQFYSINFDANKRKKEKIKYSVFHYTGMKSEKSAVNRLCDKNSKVSCHYFIKENGCIINLVPDKYIAWHAGISNWKNLKFINKYSIGVEIQNPGHQYGYKDFNKKQISAIKHLSINLAKKYKFKRKNILGHSDISPDRKKDPGEKFPWELLSKYRIGIWHSINKNSLKKYRLKKIDNSEKKMFLNHLKKIGYFIKRNKVKSTLYVVNAFQRRFRPQLINGKIDLECVKIAKSLIKSGFN